MAHLHEHSHAQNSSVTHRKSFAIGIGLNIVFVIIEVVYGLIANSSALLADAGHNASDVLGLIFAWTAAWLATMKPKGKYNLWVAKNNHIGFHSQCPAAIWCSGCNCLECI